MSPPRFSIIYTVHCTVQYSTRAFILPGVYCRIFPRHLGNLYSTVLEHSSSLGYTVGYPPDIWGICTVYSTVLEYSSSPGYTVQDIPLTSGESEPNFRGICGFTSNMTNAQCLFLTIFLKGQCHEKKTT